VAQQAIVTLLLASAVLAGGNEVLPEERGGTPGTTISINGALLYYEQDGSGPPLVLLHHFGSSSQAWKPFVPEFAKRYRVIAIDLRGHGRSTNPSDQFTHRQVADDILGVLDALGISRFKAIGASSGAMALLHMATREPDRVEAMVLVGGAPYFPEEARAIHRAHDCEANLTPEEWERKRQLHLQGDDQIRALARQFCAFETSYDDLTFTPPQLATIKAHTLIVHGDRDAPLPVPIALEMYRAIPRSYLWVIPNGDHLPVFRPEHRAEFQRIVLAFLGGQWERDR
jgi:pimeloyl-ACP methyl ester carboxylesterase